MIEQSKTTDLDRGMSILTVAACFFLSIGRVIPVLSQNLFPDVLVMQPAQN